MTYSSDDRDDVRRRVLAAWEAEVTADGYGQVTLAAVAKRAGLARSSLYRYFPSKEAIYLAHLEDRVAGVVGAVREEVLAQRDAPARLRRLLVGEMGQFTQSPELALSDVPDLVSREGRRRLVQCFTPLRLLVREILEQGRADGSLPALDIDKALPVVFACIDVFREHLAGQPIERDAMADDVADFVLRGLGASVPPRRPATAAGARGTARR
jgi:AcrR family transcriptional regulator